MMNTFVVSRDICRLCGGRELERVLSLARTPVGDAYVPADRVNQQQETFPLELVLCGACWNVQLRHVVDPNMMYRDYAYVTSISVGLREHFQQYAEAMLARVKPASGSLVVDSIARSDRVLYNSVVV